MHFFDPGGGLWSGSVLKAVSLYLPHFATDLIVRGGPLAGRPESVDKRGRVASDRPVLLYTAGAGRQIVARRCRRAAVAGVREGMTMAYARALLSMGGAIIRPQEPQREQAALRALAGWALKFSPIVAVDPPDGLLVDVAGCEHLFGGLERLVHRFADEVVDLGLGARVAAGPTFACARAVARFGSADRAIVCEGTETLARLPVAALGVDRAVVDALGEVGIERIGHLLKLPRSALATRFGPGLLRRLDQAAGLAPETIDPIRPLSPPLAERVFAGPATQLEAIQLTVGGLLAELAELLERRGCGARELELQLDRIDAPPVRVVIALSRPSRDVGHLRSLLVPRVESINLGCGVVRVAVRATHLGPLAHEQMLGWGRWEGDGVGGAVGVGRLWGELLDALSNRLGPDRVVRAEPVETHLPEGTFRFRSVLETGGPPEHKGPQSPPSDRPSLLLERPEPLTVIAMTPEGPPAWLRWRDLQQRVVASAGPERIAAEWWRGKALCRTSNPEPRSPKPETYARAYGEFILGRQLQPGDLRRSRGEQSRVQGSGVRVRRFPEPRTPNPEPAIRAFTRDYFKVQDERGRWLWVYRVLESGDWFIHGLWA